MVAIGCNPRQSRCVVKRGGLLLRVVADVSVRLLRRFLRRWPRGVAEMVVGPCSYVATIDMGGRHIPQVFALMNMSGNFAAALTPVLVARFFEATNN